MKWCISIVSNLQLNFNYPLKHPVLQPKAVWQRQRNVLDYGEAWEKKGMKMSKQRNSRAVGQETG